MSSRLFLSLVDRDALAYDVSSGLVEYADAGSLEVSAGVDPARLPAALDAILVELARLRDDRIPDGELAKTKAFLSGGLELRMDETRHLASWVGGQEALHDRVLTLDEALAAVEAVTAEEVHRLAGTLIRDDLLRMAVVAPARYLRGLDRHLRLPAMTARGRAGRQRSGRGRRGPAPCRAPPAPRGARPRPRGARGPAPARGPRRRRAGGPRRGALADRRPRRCGGRGHGPPRCRRRTADRADYRGRSGGSRRDARARRRTPLSSARRGWTRDHSRRLVRRDAASSPWPRRRAHPACRTFGAAGDAPGPSRSRAQRGSPSAPRADRISSTLGRERAGLRSGRRRGAAALARLALALRLDPGSPRPSLDALGPPSRPRRPAAPGRCAPLLGRISRPRPPSTRPAGARRLDPTVA